MHRKKITRDLLAVSLALMLVVAVVTVLVLAAPDDPEETPEKTAFVFEEPVPAPVPEKAPVQEPEPIILPLEQPLLALDTDDCPAASVRFLYADEVIPFKTVYMDDNTLRLGVEVEEQPGVEGILRETTEIMLHDGTEVARQYVGRYVALESVDRIVRRGTLIETYSHDEPVTTGASRTTTYAINAGVGSYDATRNMLSHVTIDKDAKTITTPSGEIFTYVDQLLGEATAYSCEGEINPRTFSGTPARVGEVAVDPKFIPIGTEMFIVLQDGSMIYGHCIAEDTGGAVKGNVIDLYVNTFADCYLVGRAPCDVYVLSWG